MSTIQQLQEEMIHSFCVFFRRNFGSLNHQVCNRNLSVDDILECSEHEIDKIVLTAFESGRKAEREEIEKSLDIITQYGKVNNGVKRVELVAKSDIIKLLNKV